MKQEKGSKITKELFIWFFFFNSWTFFLNFSSFFDKKWLFMTIFIKFEALKVTEAEKRKSLGSKKSSRANLSDRYWSKSAFYFWNRSRVTLIIRSTLRSICDSSFVSTLFNEHAFILVIYFYYRTCPNVTLPPSKRLGIDELFDSSGKPRPPILRDHLRKEGRLTNECAMKLIQDGSSRLRTHF